MKVIIFKFLFGYFGLQVATLLDSNVLAGLFCGIVVGHVIDHVATIRFFEWRMGRQQQAQAKAAFQSEFLGSLFFMLGKLSGCDGAIDSKEVAEVERIISEVLKLNRKDRSRAIAAFKSARTNGATFQSMSVRYFELYQSYPQMLETTVQMLLRVAAADGAIQEPEERLVHAAATVFGIGESRYHELRRPFFNSSGGVDSNGGMLDIEKCYALLGCRRNDSVNDIKRSYRKLVAEFHPDKIYSKELPQEFMDFANQKMKDIQHAYETVKAERGFT